MTTTKVFMCSCGGTPEATVYRLAEDLMGAKAACPKCGLEAEEIEHVWGGQEAREMAYGEWNRMRVEKPDKKPQKVCPDCEGVGAMIVDGEFGPKCKTCDGRRMLEVEGAPKVHLAGGVRGTLCGSQEAKSKDAQAVTCPVCVAYLVSVRQRDP